MPKSPEGAKKYTLEQKTAIEKSRGEELLKAEKIAEMANALKGAGLGDVYELFPFVQIENIEKKIRELEAEREKIRELEVGQKKLGISPSPIDIDDVASKYKMIAQKEKSYKESKEKYERLYKEEIQERKKSSAIDVLHIDAEKKDALLEMVRKDGLSLRNFSEELIKDNLDIAVEAIKQNPKAIQYIPSDLKASVAELLELGKRYFFDANS